MMNKDPSDDKTKFIEENIRNGASSMEGMKYLPNEADLFDTMKKTEADQTGQIDVRI